MKFGFPEFRYNAYQITDASIIMAIPGSIMVIVCIYRIEVLLYRPDVVVLVGLPTVCDNNKLTSFDCIQTDTVGNFFSRPDIILYDQILIALTK